MTTDEYYLTHGLRNIFKSQVFFLRLQGAEKSVVHKIGLCFSHYSLALQLKSDTTSDTTARSESRNCTSSTQRYCKKKQGALVEGKSQLSCTGAPICQPDRELWEVCCLLKVKVQNIAERVTQLVKSTDNECNQNIQTIHATFSYRHEWYKLEPRQNQERPQSPGGASKKYCCPSYLFFHFISQTKEWNQK